MRIVRIQNGLSDPGVGEMYSLQMLERFTRAEAKKRKDVKEEMKCRETHQRMLLVLRENTRHYFFDHQLWNGETEERGGNLAFLQGAGPFLAHLAVIYGKPKNIFPELIPDPPALPPPYNLEMFERFTVVPITEQDVDQLIRRVVDRKATG